MILNMCVCRFMNRAIALSRESALDGGYPVGAVVVITNEVVGTGKSDGKRKRDATQHAEIAAIRDASVRIGSRDLWGAELYSSMEPCLMCLAACFWAKINAIHYAIPSTKHFQSYREGLHQNHEINKLNHRRMELIHDVEFELDALKVLISWERTIR